MKNMPTGVNVPIDRPILSRYVLSYWVGGNVIRACLPLLPKMVGAEIPRLLPGPSGGDGVLVYFGYPHAHEDDAERAVHVRVRGEVCRERH